MGAERIDAARRLAALPVDLLRNCFEVGRIAAGAVPAEVVHFKPRRDGPMLQLEENDMRAEGFPCLPGSTRSRGK